MLSHEVSPHMEYNLMKEKDCLLHVPVFIHLASLESGFLRTGVSKQLATIQRNNQGIQPRPMHAMRSSGYHGITSDNHLIINTVNACGLSSHFTPVSVSAHKVGSTVQRHDINHYALSLIRICR